MTSPARPAADTPWGGLPAAEPVLHARHNLELVIVEIRYAGATGSFGSDSAIALREALEAIDVDLPALEAVKNQEVSLQVGPDGPDARVTARDVGWQLASADGRTSAVVSSEVIRVQTANYVRWSESLARPLEVILRAAHPLLLPQLVSRIGVRFINRFTDPQARSPRAWLGRIERPFLGPIADDVCGEHLQASQQQLDLTLGPAQGAIVRHGAFPDPAERGAVSYLLDVDTYNQAGLRPDPGTILEEATRLDRTALALFQQITTPAFREQMSPYPREEPSTDPTSATYAQEENA